LVESTARLLTLDEASLVLHDPHHEVRHLLIHGGVDPYNLQGVLFRASLETLGPSYVHLREPWLGPYDEQRHGSLFRAGGRLKSVAVLPLERQGYLFGSLNLGSGDGGRYTSQHGTEFHARLGSVAAVCLENAINRQRLVLSGLTDILTGWYNRRYLEQRLPEEIARARRYQQPLSGLLMDVDHFKRINDTLGHPAGDEVLRGVSGRARKQLRSSDVGVRYGGEEFAVLLPQTGLDDAAKLAERMRETVASTPFVLKTGESISVTISIGAAQAPAEPSEASEGSPGDQLLVTADAALYRAKTEGRNRVVCAAD